MVKKAIKKIFSLRPINVELKRCNESNSLLDKTALILGGGTGIGNAIAKRFESAGANVIVAGRNLHDNHFEYIQWNVLSVKEIPEKFEMAVKKFGKIDIVVNSQGICPEKDFRGKIWEITDEDFNEVININLRSVYFICQMAGRYFIENKVSGNILNIASTEGLKGCLVPYGISKSGVISLTKGFGKLLAPHNIIVNGIAPGATATDMMRLQDNDLRKAYIPSQRMTTPDEIAETALLMVSDMGRNMCGQIIVVDGGESLK